jgi:release factor glutamine methyltransferase
LRRLVRTPCQHITASITKTVYGGDVYEPSDDSFALVDALAVHSLQWGTFRPAVTLELGCGSGFVVCSCALLLSKLGISSHTMAIDISMPATRATQKTLEAHGISGVDIVCTDKFAALEEHMQGKVDLLLFNPPYVVTPDEEVTRGGIAAAWAGGKDGRVVIDAVLAKLDCMLSTSGRMYMIAIHENRPEEIMQLMRERHGFFAKAVLTRRADEELISVLLISRTPV